MSEQYNAEFCRNAYEKYRDFAERVWIGYQFYARGSSVIRKGFENVGAAAATNDSLDYAKTFYRRSESDLEHQAKTTWLASTFAINIPEFFGGERYYTLSTDQWLRLTMALTHDAGECETDDAMDDGGPEHEAKEEAELVAFKKMLIAYPEHIREEMTKMFKSFQKKDSREAMALVALDKAEAILTNLLLEKHGIYGKISAKLQPTKQDLYYAELYGSDASADVWGAHMSDRTTKDFLSEIMEPVVALIVAASLDVRREELACLKMH